MEYAVSVDIDAPPERVWEVIADVERWPEWSASMREVRLVKGDRLAVGARARVRQPKLLPATWEVTELQPLRGFTWETSSPGMKMVGRHEIAPRGDGVTVTLSMRSSGPVARIIEPFVRELGKSYVQLEAEGLKARASQDQ